MTWLVETEADRWLVKIGLVAPSQRNLADLTTPGFPHPPFPLGTQGPPPDSSSQPTKESEALSSQREVMGVVTKDPWGGSAEGHAFLCCGTAQPYDGHKGRCSGRMAWVPSWRHHRIDPDIN